MAALKVDVFMTPEEYLRREEVSLEKHEYLAGLAYALHRNGPRAMAGASRNHVAINTNLTVVIGALLKGSSCRVMNSDQRVRVAEAGLYTYPDLTITCGEREYEGETLLNPTVIFEVLSPSTGAYDRGEKFAHYRRLPSLQAVVFVAQDQPAIEVYTRRRDDLWTLTAEATGLDAVAALEAIAVNLPLADVYDGVAFPDPPVRLGLSLEPEPDTD